MECKKAQDGLITGYVDRELGPAERAALDAHLAACPDCRAFLETVRKTSLASLKEVGELKPDDSVWEGIEMRIDEERDRARGWFGTLADALAPLFRISTPVFRLAFVTAMILAIVVVAKWPSSYADPVYGYISEQMTFMNNLKTGTADPLNGDLKDYETAFEDMLASSGTFS